MTDMVSAIMDYESGQLSDAATVELFAGLVRTGHAWSLQGHYGRTAAAMISNGLLDDDGTITDYARSVIVDGWTDPDDMEGRT